jgi:hypothetical protein
MGDVEILARSIIEKGPQEAWKPPIRRPRLSAWIASVFLLLQLTGKQIDYFLSI